MNRVPPLHDLTAFEAAARHMSFLKAAGLDWPGPESGALYEDAMLMYQAAASGQGVALTLKTLFEGYSAQLVKPFALEVWDRAYTIVLAPEAAQKAAVKLFTGWLQLEAGILQPESC